MDKAALVISCIALALGIWATFDGGGMESLPGDGIGAYDFDTPEAALESGFRIMVRADVRAQVQLGRARQLEVDRDKNAAALKSLSVAKTMVHEGKTCVFYTVEERDRVRHRTEWFQKGKDDRWYRVHVGTYSLPRKSAVRDAIDDWEGRPARRVKKTPSLSDAVEAIGRGSGRARPPAATTSEPALAPVEAPVEDSAARAPVKEPDAKRKGGR